MQPTPHPTTRRVAANVRAEASRRRVSQGTIGDLLALTQSNVSRRLAGDVPFTVLELVTLAGMWAIPLSQLLPDDLADGPSTG